MKQILTYVIAFFLIQYGTVAFSNEAAHEKNNSVTAETSLKWLINGNLRFLKQGLRKDGATPKDVQKLSSGQHPHAIVLSCSDSRVPPEVVFDQKLGEIFVVRTAGQSLADNVIGSIEYAVEHLGSQLIVVMGHTSCGAVKAAHESLGGKSLGTKSLDVLVKDIHPRIKDYKGQKPSPKFEKESWANTDGVASDLVKRSDLIREKVEKGELTIVPSLYDLDSGEVVFTQKHDNQKKVKVRSSASELSSH